LLIQVRLDPGLPSAEVPAHQPDGLVSLPPLSHFLARWIDIRLPAGGAGERLPCSFGDGIDLLPSTSRHVGLKVGWFTGLIISAMANTCNSSAAVSRGARVCRKRQPLIASAKHISLGTLGSCVTTRIPGQQLPNIDGGDRPSAWTLESLLGQLRRDPARFPARRAQHCDPRQHRFILGQPLPTSNPPTDLVTCHHPTRPVTFKHYRAAVRGAHTRTRSRRSLTLRGQKGLQTTTAPPPPAYLPGQVRSCQLKRAKATSASLTFSMLPIWPTSFLAAIRSSMSIKAEAERLSENSPWDGLPRPSSATDGLGRPSHDSARPLSLVFG